MLRRCILLVALFAFALGAGFTASVTITDPTVSGKIKGKFYYNIDNQKRRIDYNLNGEVVIQIVDPVSHMSYKHCSFFKCEAAANNLPPLVFEPTSDWKIKPIDEERFEYHIDQKQSLYVSDITKQDKQIVKAKTNTNVEYVFSDYQNSVDDNVFNEFQKWDCPKTSCNQPVDAILVVDISGSITSDQWTSIVNFSRNFAGSFSFGQDKSRMGLVWFGNDAYAKTMDNGRYALYSDKISFQNTINQNRPTQAESSCIGCGIKLAMDMFAANQRKVPQIMLILSDGQNNIPRNNRENCWKWEGNSCSGSGGRRDDSGTTWKSMIEPMQRQTQMTVYGIGVGMGDITDDFMTQISSKNSYVKVGNYNDLIRSVERITTKTCPATNDVTCNCNGGFCACGGQCLCPSECPNTDCTWSTCTVPRLGCNAPRPVDCKTDMCHDVTCVQGTGCVTTPKICPGANGCTDTRCEGSVGCSVFSNISNCAVGLRPEEAACLSCKDNQCFKNPGCVCGTLVCPTCQECDPATGTCKPLNCDDKNECTADSCDPVNGTCIHPKITCDDNNMCTNDTCVSTLKGGCLFTPFNVSTVCDDLSVCTNDTCLPDRGCVNIPLPCNTTGSPCDNTTCDRVFGCQTIPTDCYSVGNLSKFVGDCHTIHCNATSGCFLALVEGASTDSCGYCSSEGGAMCKLPWILGAGAIAGIAVGAAAGAAILGFAGKKGYDFFAANAAAAGGVQNNPLYAGNQSGGYNPMYES